MGIIKLGSGYKSNTSLELAPKRLFSSGSGGVTGSINVIVNRSNYQKDNIDLREGLTGTEGSQNFSESTFEARRDAVYSGKRTAVGQGTIFGSSPTPFNYELQLALLMDGANPSEAQSEWPPELFKAEYNQLNLDFAESGYSDLSMHPRNAFKLNCSRSVPGTDFTSNDFRKKEVIRNILDEGHRTSYSSLGWAYGNFNCLNFFKTWSSNTPAVVYNSPSNRYLPTTSLGIDFRIKVNNYPQEIGTIIHLPGAFAVSVAPSSNFIIGEIIDSEARVSKFRLVLQLGTDASGSTEPGNIDLTIDNNSRGNTQIFQSLDNITASMWHDCSIRISETQNNLTGTFLIDGNISGYFNPTGSFAINSSLSQTANIMSIGAFYTGTLGNSNLFFADQTSTSQGVEGSTVDATHPDHHTFISPLDAEIFEIKVSDEYRSLDNITNNLNSVVTSSNTLFYLPGLFSSNSPQNLYEAISGDLGSATDSSTDSNSLAEFYASAPVNHSAGFDSPFNTNHSNIGGFLNINAQAFLRDFITGKFPYMSHMSSSMITYTDQHFLSASWEFHDEHQRRNTLIVPCDDGMFRRDFGVYEDSQLTGSVVISENPGALKLDNLGNFSSNYDSKISLVDEGWRYSASESLELGDTTNPVTVPNMRFFDPVAAGIIGASEKSSNMVVMFSIPSLFYGNRIRPNTLRLRSNLYRGNNHFYPNGYYDGMGNFTPRGVVMGQDYRNDIHLCDDGNGNLLRCDTSGSIAHNPIGSVYYEEGIIVIKSPHLYSFGEHNFDLEFEGVQNIHVLELMVPIEKNNLNTSTNPNFRALRPSSDNNEEAEEFVYLTTVNFHDKNMNIVAKTKLARPVIKRTNDKYMVKVKFDF